MRFTNENNNEEILLGMLDLVIDILIENHHCFYCRNNSVKPQKECFDGDLCKSYLFDGLAFEIKTRGKGKCISARNKNK